MKKLIQATLVSMALILVGQTMAIAATPASSETTGQYVSSSAITTKVKAALLNTPGLSSTKINVKTHKGVVSLSGTVDTKAESQLAEQTAAQVSGVQGVQNNLMVRNN